MDSISTTELAIILIGGLGPIELVITLVVLLVIFAGARFNYLARGMADSMEEWRRQNRLPEKSPGRRFFITGMLCGISLIVISELESRGTVSAAQALALMAVTVGWSVVGYYCIGKRSER